jgi:hypothetical protein
MPLKVNIRSKELPLKEEVYQLYTKKLSLSDKKQNQEWEATQHENQKNQISATKNK